MLNKYTIIYKVLIVTIISISILSISNYLLKNKIQDAELEFYNAQLNSLVKDIKFNNNILQSKISLAIPKYLDYLGNDKSSLLYIAKYNNIPTAVIVKTSTPDGYNGTINLLIAIELQSIINKKSQNTITNIKVLQHQETPGLGDVIEPEKSNWLQAFYNQNIDNLNIDSITGATITSQAVTGAINNALLLINNYPELYENQ
jgi:electron transport complex protein RnfG